MASGDPPPPSYATRPPPGHRSGYSDKKSYKRATDLDSEDDDSQLSEAAQPSRPKRNVANPKESTESQAYYSDEEVPSDEGYPAKRKGKSRRTKYSSESDRGHDPDRENLSRALVHRKVARPDRRADRRSGRATDRRRSRDRGASDEESDYGRDKRYGRDNEASSQALSRTRDGPRDLRKSARHHGREEEEDEDMIRIKRYTNLDYQDLDPRQLADISSTFEVSLSRIRMLCQTGKICYDAKTKEICLDRIYPLFPSYMSARWKLMREEARLMKEDQGRGRRTIVRTEFVPVYDVYGPAYDPDDFYWIY